MKKKLTVILAILMVLLLTFLSGCQPEGETATSDSDWDTEEETEEIDPAVEYQYRDIICDRSLTEGKMACYFFRSNYLRPKPSGVTTSGDSSLLITPDGTTMLIDVNLTPIAGRVVDYLNRLGIEKLDYLMISHADIDHYGGYEAILNNIEVGHVLLSESPDYDNLANKAGRFLAKAKEMEIPYTKLSAGMTLELGEVHMETMWPVKDYEWTFEGVNSADRINGGSLVVKFTWKDASYLFGGDLYILQEGEVVDTYGEQVQSDIVKMNHHGLKTSNSTKWIEATNAKLVCGMVSTLKETDILEQYVYRDIPFTYSIFDGTVVVYTEGDGVYDVQVERERENTYFGDLGTKDGHFQIK